MNAERMTSSSASAGRVDGEATKAQRCSPACALRASTRWASAWSRSRPNFSEFSISSSATTEVSRPLIAAAIFSCWRANASEV